MLIPENEQLAADGAHCGTGKTEVLLSGSVLVTVL